MMKEHAAYDNLPAKQSRWEICFINDRDPTLRTFRVGLNIDNVGWR
jgi:hypothetical protein